VKLANGDESVGSGRPSKNLHVPYCGQANGTCLWGQTFVYQIGSRGPQQLFCDREWSLDLVQNAWKRFSAAP